MLVEAQAAVRLLQGVLFATVISVAFPIIVVVDCRECGFLEGPSPQGQPGFTDGGGRPWARPVLSLQPRDT